MSFQLAPRQTLLIPSGNVKHLFVILTNACSIDCHLLVNFTSIRDGIFYDNACVANVNEHEFIKHPSYIEYRHARIEKADHLNKCVTSWLFNPNQPVTTELFKRICDGLLISRHVSKRVKNYYLEQSH